MKKNTLYIIFLFLLPVCYCSGQNTTDSYNVNYEFSPEWWQTLISMPDDPVKILIGKEGQTFGDYGYQNGPRKFSYSVLFNGPDLNFVSQRLYSAKVPIVVTQKTSKVFEVEKETFLRIEKRNSGRKVLRRDGRFVISDWTSASSEIDESFLSAAINNGVGSGGGLIDLQVVVDSGVSRKVVLGFCERAEVQNEDISVWSDKKLGKKNEDRIEVLRPMDIYVEGSGKTTVNPGDDFGIGHPGVYIFDAEDLDGDGIIDILISSHPGALNREVFVNTIWMFDSNTDINEGELIGGKSNEKSIIYMPCSKIDMPERNIDELITVRNLTNQIQIFKPFIKYKGVKEVEKKETQLVLGNQDILTSTEYFGDISWNGKDEMDVFIQPISLGPNEERKIGITLSRSYTGKEVENIGIGEIEKEKRNVIEWWENYLDQFKISVPDEGIQDQLDASFRNILQARDIRGGKPSFNVGPTVYHGLWIVDGTFILETMTKLGYSQEANSGIDYMISQQLPGGGFEMLPLFYKENGIVPYLLVRYAMLNNNKEWLELRWSVIEGCIDRFSELNEKTLNDSTKSYYGLLPPGPVDGGIAYEGPEYSNIEWCLSGLRWAIDGARWLNKEGDIRKWQGMFDRILNNFQKSAMKSMRKDEYGNPYLPVMIDNYKDFPAQKGQWAFCQSVYPGLLFDENPELKKMADETLAMLMNHTEEGLVFNTGWMKDGLWNYFASFVGHALEWNGRGDLMPGLLYAMANHASPTYVWREEQKPKGKGGDEVGDMPHNWASAEFIRMTLHMIELSRGDTLSLFEGLPVGWLEPNNITSLKGILTSFGTIDLVLKVDSEGKTAKLNLNFLDKERKLPAKIRINKTSFKSSEDITLRSKRRIEVTIPIKR